MILVQIEFEVTGWGLNLIEMIVKVLVWIKYVVIYIKFLLCNFVVGISNQNKLWKHDIHTFTSQTTTRIFLTNEAEILEALY